MGNIKIVEVNSEIDKRKFIKIPWDIYKDNPNWVPPLIYDVRKNLDTNKNPFYHHARIQLYIAYNDNIPVGRIAAIINDNHNKKYNDKTGFFGYYESINSIEVSTALFDAASLWLSQNGMDTIRGPINLSINDEVGLLIKGFDKSPVLLMTYNPEYYINLIENYGFYKAKDLYAYFIEKDMLDKNQAALNKLSRVADIVLKKEKIKIRQLVLKNLESELMKVMKVYNAAWIDNWGSVMMTEDEFKFVASSLKPLVLENIVYFAEVDGEPIGFSLSIPDYNQVFKKMNGKLFPFGIFKILFGKKHIDTIRVIIMGIIPKYQRKGIEAVFIRDTINRSVANGMPKAEISWILEDNIPMVQTAVNLGAIPYKTYRVYDKKIDTDN